jgi:periplasmic divalent cation tolerance protein
MSGKTSGFVVITTTVDSEAAAQELAAALVEARLAACVQCVPIRSVYRWKGAVESAAEYLLLAKTRAALADEATVFIRGRHSYELPEIVVTPVAGGLADYLAWIRSETREARPRGVRVRCSRRPVGDGPRLREARLQRPKRQQDDARGRTRQAKGR